MSPAFGNRSTYGRLQHALGERYRLVRSIGGGRMTETFRATDVEHSRDVIVKVLAHSLAEHVDHARFLAEIARASTVQHPHCAPVIECGFADDLVYCILPFITGESLRARLVWGPLSVGETIAVLRDVAHGLDAAHAHGIVHGDVKPENVFCTGDAMIITDLGITSGLMLASDIPTSALTRTGIDVGSPTYFAPEQANGDTIDARSDWYAVGVMAFEMLTGRPPFQSPTDAGMLVEHATTMPPDIAHRRTGLPASLSALVMQWLAKDPSRRPADLDLIERALDAAVSGPYVGPVAVWQPPVMHELRNVRTPPPMAAIAAPKRPPRPSTMATTGARFAKAVATSLHSARALSGAHADEPNASTRRAARRTDAPPTPTRSPQERRLAIAAALATLLVVSASTFGMVQLFRFDGDAPEPSVAEQTFTLSASNPSVMRVRPLWLVALPDADAGWMLKLTAARAMLRMELPNAAAVPLTKSDTALADTAAIRALARARSAIAVTMYRTMRDDRSELAIMVMTDSSSTTCRFQRTVTTGADTAALLIDLQQRLLGVLAFRHNVSLQSRLSQSVLLPDATHTCRFDRYDALLLLAGARGDSLRPTMQRLADLDRALTIDSTFAEARFERARLSGPSATSGPNALAPSGVTPDAAAQRQLRAQADVAILQQLERDPAGAFTQAKRAASLGQASASVWALTAVAAGHPREALQVLDNLGTHVDTVAGAPMGPDMKAALRGDAHYMMGHDSLALAAVLPSLGLAMQMLSEVAMPAAAALGDSTRWNGLLRGAHATTPEARLSALLLAGDVAATANHEALAQVWYRRALIESEALVSSGKASPRALLQAAHARRRVNNVAGADSLLVPLELQSDTLIARSAKLERALLAVERRDENAIATAERWMREEVDTKRRWDAALTLARMHALRGNQAAATQFVRTAIELGMPRVHRTATARLGDLRAEPDLKLLMGSVDGRALLIPID